MRIFLITITSIQLKNVFTLKQWIFIVPTNKVKLIFFVSLKYNDYIYLNTYQKNIIKISKKHISITLSKQIILAHINRD